jgi:hypothetical protein
MTCITSLDYASPLWESIPGDHREELRRIVAAISEAPASGVTRWMQQTAPQLGLSYQAFRRHYYSIKNNGGDWTVIIDKRKAPEHRAATALARQPHFMAALAKIVEEHQRNNQAGFRALRRRWASRRVAIPGYETWPGWPKIPAGWTDGNLGRIVKEQTNLARMRSIRVGTSSKTNIYLPTVITTRANLWPGAVIQLDDVWHKNFVTLGKKREVVRVLELGALDLFSACRFHFGAKPRRKRDGGSYETIGGSDMRMFLAGLFHRTGYSPQGTMLMSEHNTAKVSEDIARILYDATGGMIRVDYQPIEGKQAALSGYWAGSEGGNFRAKACLESTHSLMANDLGALPMQSGHNTHGLQGPVTTDRIAAYIQRIVKSVLEKVPHREHLLKLPALDFHTQFYPFLVDYYQFGLNARTDHDLEAWEMLGHVVNEYTTIPGSGHFFSEDVFLKLPAPSQTAIRHAAAADPQSWSRRRKLSPGEVWDSRRDFLPIPPVVLCDILGGDLAREVTARKGFLEFSDQEISCDPLIYQARFCCGPRHGREIPHGEKIKMFVLPFDDKTAIVVDSKERYLGEVPLYHRVTPIDPDAFGSAAPFEERPEIRSEALRNAAGEKHSRIADILEPSRIIHADRVQDARDLREHNRRVVTGAPVTPDEIHAARIAAGQQGQRTAAANRLQAHGEATDWDTSDLSSVPVASTAWDDLPDDEPLPDAL